jgi:hypothetical protein
VSGSVTVHPELVGQSWQASGSGGRLRPVAGGPFALLAFAVAVLPIRPVGLWAGLIAAAVLAPWAVGALRRRTPRPYWRLSETGLEHRTADGEILTRYERERIEEFALTAEDGYLTIFHKFGRTPVGELSWMGFEPLAFYVIARRLGIPTHVLDGDTGQLADDALAAAPAPAADHAAERRLLAQEAELLAAAHEPHGEPLTSSLEPVRLSSPPPVPGRGRILAFTALAVVLSVFMVARIALAGPPAFDARLAAACWTLAGAATLLATRRRLLGTQQIRWTITPVHVAVTGAPPRQPTTSSSSSRRSPQSWNAHPGQSARPRQEPYEAIRSRQSPDNTAIPPRSLDNPTHTEPTSRDTTSRDTAPHDTAPSQRGSTDSRRWWPLRRNPQPDQATRPQQGPNDPARSQRNPGNTARTEPSPHEAAPSQRPPRERSLGERARALLRPGAVKSWRRRPGRGGLVISAADVAALVVGPGVRLDPATEESAPSRLAVLAFDHRLRLIARLPADGLDAFQLTHALHEHGYRVITPGARAPRPADYGLDGLPDIFSQVPGGRLVVGDDGLGWADAAGSVVLRMPAERIGGIELLTIGGHAWLRLYDSDGDEFFAAPLSALRISRTDLREGARRVGLPVTDAEYDAYLSAAFHDALASLTGSPTEDTAAPPTEPPHEDNPGVLLDATKRSRVGTYLLSVLLCQAVALLGALWLGDEMGGFVPTLAWAAPAGLLIGLGGYWLYDRNRDQLRVSPTGISMVSRRGQVSWTLNHGNVGGIGIDDSVERLPRLVVWSPAGRVLRQVSFPPDLTELRRACERYGLPWGPPDADRPAPPPPEL